MKVHLDGIDFLCNESFYRALSLGVGGNFMIEVDHKVGLR